jgi:hypothetical protein
VYLAPSSKKAYGPMAADSTNVYFLESPATITTSTYYATVMSCPLGLSCTTSGLLARVLVYDVYGPSEIASLAASGGLAYYDYAGVGAHVYGGSSFFSTAGGSATSDGTEVCDGPDYYGSYATSWVAAGTGVYFTGTELLTGTIEWCGTGCPGGAAAPCDYFALGQPQSMATDGTNLYWTNFGPSAEVLTCPLGAPCTSPRVVASGQFYPNYIAVNSTRVFWTTPTGVLSAAK